jgi:hypothetical protein
MRQALSLLILSISFASYAADQSPPSWLQPDTIMAAIAIQLSQEQLPQFRDALTDLINNQITATSRLLRGNNVADLERKVQTETIITTEKGWWGREYPHVPTTINSGVQNM